MLKLKLNLKLTRSEKGNLGYLSYRKALYLRSVIVIAAVIITFVLLDVFHVLDHYVCMLMAVLSAFPLGHFIVGYICIVPFKATEETSLLYKEFVQSATPHELMVDLVITSSVEKTKHFQFMYVGNKELLIYTPIALNAKEIEYWTSFFRIPEALQDYRVSFQSDAKQYKNQLQNQVEISTHSKEHISTDEIKKILLAMAV